MFDYDPYSDEVMRDPWPCYARLRRDAPVYYSEKYDAWFLSRFEDIWQATLSDALTAEQGVTPAAVLLKQPPPPDPVFSMLDLPRQRDYRKMLSPRYSPRAVAGLEDFVRAEVRGLLETVVDRGHFDVYADVAAPTAARVIARLLGMPPELTLELAALVERFFRRARGQVGPNEDNMAAFEELMPAIVGFLAECMKEPPADPDSHVAVMLRTEAEGRPMSPASIGATIFTMLVTGIEVVPLSVSNTIVYLAEHPDQRGRLVADPTLIPAAFAESLRYDQPTNLLGRFVKNEMTIGGETLRPGQGVMLLWASGNRDEAEFEHADRFDMDRRPRRSLSYGHGLHKCIGEHLGNLEGRVLLEEILRVAPDYVVAEGAERVYSEFLHGYHKVPIEFAPRRSS